MEALPNAIKIVKDLPTEGEDLKYMENIICEYGQNQIVLIVQRYKNHMSILVQLKYDRTNTGKFEHTRSVIQVSPEDDIESLQKFGVEMAERACQELVKAREAEIEIPDQVEEMEETKE